MTSPLPLPVTPLREVYKALGLLHEQEQTGVAEAHAEPFFRLVSALCPRYFVMENVPGMAKGGHASILPRRVGMG